MNRESILQVLPVSIRTRFLRVGVELDSLQEIRLRAGKPLLLLCGGRELRTPFGGEYRVTPEEVRETVQYAAGYSLYAYEPELRKGYLTIEGGHRVGIAGQVIRDGDGIRNFRYISSVNIRIAHQAPGCADGVLPGLIRENRFFNTLIIGPPGCGKTTLLRDLIRQLSDGSRWLGGKTVGVVDERSELGGCYRGICQNDLGIRTDLLDACPKEEGMLMLIRSMSPQIIAVDELGSPEEVQALRYAMCCGCGLLATAHGEDLRDIRGKPALGELFERKLFQRYVVMSPQTAGKTEGIYDEEGARLC